MTPEQERAVGMIIEVLEELRVPYFVTGSVAAIFHGVVRLSHDADIAFAASHGNLPKQLSERVPSVYVDVPDEKKRQFNAIAATIGYKIDFWPLEDTPFDRSQFARRVRGTIAGRPAWFASLEDLILSKLDWYNRGKSELQWRDLTGLVAEHCDTLDRVYLERWADELGLRAHLDRLLRESQR